ncbi:ABC transporter ATP-binding protein [Paenibacillus faecis]|uniref:ABC transporter ATP-binding protein n=1 Tax=Paenibacillus faecis TaxID=862114 RepID=UPI000F97968F|nr:ABC transporter ATP-binding protein [Paenibacillus faecis]GIO84638.1 ABC transporter ATP-binding protein [Paenibacillus faecis]
MYFEALHVSYSYDKQKLLFSGVDMSMETGKMYAIVGPSGSGKTTLLSILGGLDSPIQGKVLFNGEDIAQKGLEYHRRHHVALVFQNYNLIDYMNPVENIKMITHKNPLEILKRLGLTDEEAKRNILQLSGGQQQRVAIARALASDAPVLLADEPTGNLDEDNAAEITEILRESAHEFQKCVVVVTHSNEVAKKADYIYRIKRGKVQGMEA